MALYQEICSHLSVMNNSVFFGRQQLDILWKLHEYDNQVILVIVAVVYVNNNNNDNNSRAYF